MKDYYEVLDISPKASEKDIKTRFRFLSHAYHPDKFATSEQKEQAEEIFKLKSEAYQVLSVKERRTSYDKKRNKGRRFSDGVSNDVGDIQNLTSSIKKAKSLQKMYLIGFGILAIIATGVIINISSQGRGIKDGSVSASAPTSLVHPQR